MFFTHIAQFVLYFCAIHLEPKSSLFRFSVSFVLTKYKRNPPLRQEKGGTPYSANSRIARIWQIEPRITKTWNTQCMNGFSLPLPYRIAPIV